MMAQDGDTLYQKVKTEVLESQLLRRGDRVLAAVSGGPDSVALLHLLTRLAPELSLELRVLSLDHGLRGQRGRADREFVARLAQHMGLPFTGAEVDTLALARRDGLSVEDAARRARYAVFERVAGEWGSGPAGPVKVALGHTLDDQAETVLMRVVEGTGLDGLGGMSPIREAGGWVVIRPLLRITRAATRDYCRRWNLNWREDETNADLRFRRNFIRLKVLPLLRECNPQVVPALARLADLAREDAAALTQAAEQLAPELVWRGVPPGEHPFAGVRLESGSIVSVPLTAFKEVRPALARRLVRRLAADLAGSNVLRELGRGGVEAVLEAAAGPRVGARLDLPGDLVLEIGYEHLFLALKSRPGGAAREGAAGRAGGDAPRSGNHAPPAVELVIPGRTRVDALGWVFETEWTGRSQGPTGPDPFSLAIDPERVSLPLKVRTRRPGDVFRPAGLGGSKKLKDYFISMKVPRADRDRWPLVVDAADRILWVVGLRADERALPPGGPEPGGGRNLLRIRAERNGSKRLETP